MNNVTEQTSALASALQAAGFDPIGIAAAQQQHIGSDFDDFLKEEGIYEEVNTAALHKVAEAIEADALLEDIEFTDKQRSELMQSLQELHTMQQTGINPNEPTTQDFVSVRMIPIPPTTHTPAIVNSLSCECGEEFEPAQIEIEHVFNMRFTHIQTYPGFECPSCKTSRVSKKGFEFTKMDSEAFNRLGDQLPDDLEHLVSCLKLVNELPDIVNDISNIVDELIVVGFEAKDTANIAAAIHNNNEMPNVFNKGVIRQTDCQDKLFNLAKQISTLFDILSSVKQ